MRAYLNVFRLIRVLAVVFHIVFACSVRLMQTVKLVEIVIPLVSRILLVPKFVALADLIAVVNNVPLPQPVVEHALNVFQIVNVATEKIVPRNSTRVP